MAEVLKKKYQDALEDVNLVPSSGGVFEVSLDGDPIYSKLKTGRFPRKKDITKAIDKTL